VSVVSSAPPEALWELVSDPASPARFSPELVEARFVDGGPPRLGAEIEGRNENGTFTWTTRSTVVACDEPTSFSWATGGVETPGATWSFELEPSGTGATLSHRVVFHVGGEPLTAAILAEPQRAHEIVEGRLAQVLDAMRRVVTGIAGLAEGADASSPRD
jgi:uncharacterized protein YndB with AHSA1/START domain